MTTPITQPATEADAPGSEDSTPITGEEIPADAAAIETPPPGTFTNKQLYNLENLKIYIDLLKWVVISVVFGWISLQFSQAIHDRKQGAEEIGLYDDYLKYVINSKLDDSYQLARYFSKVTASEDLRKGWERYFQAIEPEYLTYKRKTDSAKRPIDSLALLLPTKHGVDSAALSKQITTYSAKLVNIEDNYNKVLIGEDRSVANLSQTTVYIQYGKNKNGAEKLATLIKTFGCIVPAIDNKLLYTKPNAEIRYFTKADKINATELKARIKNANPGYDIPIVPFFGVKNAKPYTLELWLN
ncbi:hypothetical protein [Mucilaginibacter gilvus]|uniref:Uncharacterized protein n=1 Tax=Mucilaginibacter gilvus TaxID=2305909 RepID=A0A3S4Y7Z2_9SPHI|nr:hypothetical protein [Mucilaginibacter gilvus]RWY49363.1 hypothetical protein EPL05_18305 [Mucilaginibacter gilvus]